MTLSWSFRRRLIYSGVILCIALALIAYIWVQFFTTTPTCFDNKQNGSEVGVDCGGTCALLCAQEARAPVVLWARAFQNGTNSYTAAAYVQNNNGEVGAHSVHYAFQLFDAGNNLVVEKDGVMDIPPVQTIPVIEPSINTGNRAVARTLFSFTDAPVWERVVHGSVPAIRITGQTLTTDAKRLDATIENDSLTDYHAVTVVGVLFDSVGVARAASKSVVPTLPHRMTQDVVFTWPTSTPDISRAEISVLPSF